MLNDKIMSAHHAIENNKWCRSAFCRIGANASFLFYGSLWHGDHYANATEADCPDCIAALRDLLGEPITPEISRLFGRADFYASLPSKAWNKGAPMRELILYARKCVQVRREDDKRAEELMIKQEEDKRHAELLAVRAKRSQRMIKDTARAIKASMFRPASK